MSKRLQLVNNVWTQQGLIINRTGKTTAHLKVFYKILLNGSQSSQDPGKCPNAP